jgi:hypothetical protein
MAQLTPESTAVWIACAAPIGQVQQALRELPALRIKLDICGTAHILLDPNQDLARDALQQLDVERAICSALEAAGLEYEALRVASGAFDLGSHQERA